ncbi:MAG: hypothetical protein IIW07_00325, partial [Clostridia bacterium]|nr:hypothetical protein [Clostridia bacterium]
MKKVSLFLVAVMLLSLCACGHTHVYTQGGMPPTCTQAGWSERICECGYRESAELPATGHTEESVPATDATCTEDGLTAGKVCSVCGEIILPQEVIAAVGHAYGEWKTVKESTLTEKGQREKTCSACGDKVTQELPVLDPPNESTYNVTYDLAGGNFVGGYTATAQV